MTVRSADVSVSINKKPTELPSPEEAIKAEAQEAEKTEVVLTPTSGSGVYIDSGSYLRGTFRVKGDFTCGNNVTIDGDVICEGKAVIGKSSRINGKLNVKENLTLGDGVAVEDVVAVGGAISMGKDVKLGNLVTGGSVLVAEEEGEELEVNIERLHEIARRKEYKCLEKGCPLSDLCPEWNPSTNVDRESWLKRNCPKSTE